MIALLEGIETYLRDSLTQSPILAVAVAFVGGILASFTPCVYPMIPIIVGYIGSSQERSRLRAFLLSLFYVIGMALTFAILGVVAALTGGFMGQVQSKPYPHLVVGSIIVLFALSLLGVFALPIPQFLKRGPAKKRRGFFGALSMGFASGFIAAPCTAAVLGVLLVYVSSRQNVVFGVVTLFSFAMGLGVLLMVIGTFTGVVAALPKSGRWMEVVEKIFGWGMLVLGEYFFVKAGILWYGMV